MRTRPRTTIDFMGAIELSGTLRFDEATGLLELDTEDGEMPERLSVRLDGYGIDTPAGHAWIKDWSEHQGVTDSLVAAGAVEVVQTVQVGPFSSTAHLVRPKVQEWEQVPA